MVELGSQGGEANDSSIRADAAVNDCAKTLQSDTDRGAPDAQCTLADHRYREAREPAQAGGIGRKTSIRYEPQFDQGRILARSKDDPQTIGLEFCYILQHRYPDCILCREKH